ncbi:MAG: hypothetical protein K5778_05960 [Bacteroidaceae bacterium]|nr:hypothetical protein [Bacteroidaceae bacterium]
MKTKVLATLCVILMLCGCRAHMPVAQQSGKEDIAYLLFVSPNEYINQDVTVTIDGATSFEAKVVSAKKSNRRGTQYGVATGKHQLTVRSDGRTIYSKQVFLSPQETKIIQLP